MADPKIIDDGQRNPLIVVSPDDVWAFVRGAADAAGYADRASLAMQITFDMSRLPGAEFKPDADGRLVLIGVPEILLMVSNRPNSREKA